MPGPKEIYDFDTPPSSDPTPEYPFDRSDRSTPIDVAWSIFSRLYVKRLNSFMCVAPIGFRDELQETFELICTKHGKAGVAFECDEICEKILPEHFERIMNNRSLIRTMLIKSASMYPGTANSISEDEARILATALGFDGVGKLVPLKLENGNMWSPV